ncbi:MAG: hypothetical protein KF696_16110 [Planctomycetes bacterium]|nr:hypothetical protein [Planctomycetota bacterium]MCW8137259.1 hypothetical protein [Planctomycetota bacterium]
MKVEEFKDIVRARPFRSFRVNLADGRRVEAGHPDFLWLAEGGRTCFIETTEGIEIIDVLLVQSVNLDSADKDAA